VRFSREYPERYFDVGIAEQHAVTFAAGLACEGMKPVVAIYSTFLQRGYDQMIHDVALQNLPVLFAVDRGGIVGADGATHIGAFDLSYLRCLPNVVVMAPADEDECRQMLFTGFTLEGPAVVRYPRGTGPGVSPSKAMASLPLGRGEVRRESSRRVDRLAILAFGSLLQAALDAGETIDATVVNMRFVKPLDVELLLRLASEHSALVTVEEHVVGGGAGSGVAEALAAAGVTVPLLHLGLPDRFPDHGDPAVILRECGLDSAGITQAIRRRFGKRRLESVPKPAV
jgi:1-deoxy-D-xylulose-5-phosphate synthase